MISATYHVIQLALQSFFRNIWLSLATLTVIIITLLLVNVIVTIQYIKDAALHSLERQIDISLDFKPTVPEAEVREIRDALMQDQRIANVEVISGDQNISELGAKYPFLLDTVLPALENNPLGFTLKIVARDFANYPALLSDLERDQQYDELLLNRNLNDHRLFISRVTIITDRLNKGLLAAALIFLGISLIIVFNTVKVGVYTHRDEISIMRLVGASNWFVQMPYILEAFIYAVVAVGVTAGIVFGAVYLLEPLTTAFFGSILTFDLASHIKQNALPIFGAQFAVTLLVIVISALVSSRKYLRT